MKPILPFLEIMVNHGCNLACHGCTTYSDLKYSGFYKWKDGKSQIKPWIDRLEISAIGLIGGEPLVNPDLKDWIIGIRKLLPDAQIRFVTNGFLSIEKWEIFELLRDIGNTVYKISYHVPDSRLDAAIEKIMSSLKWDAIYEHGIHRYINYDYNFRFQVAKPEKFLKTFLNDYENMAPHNSTDAFEFCVQKRCPMLYNGQIFKCGTLALTEGILERFNYPNLELWKPYLKQGLSPNCSDSQLSNFLDNFGKSNTLCRQCPGSKDLDSFFDHSSTVKLKFK